MTLKIKSAAVAAAAVFVAASCYIPSASAQTAPAAPSTPQQQGAPATGAVKSLDQHKLKSFAVAYLQVDKIKRQYEPELAKAKDSTERQKIQTEANQKMVAAVNQVDDMNVQEYSSILESAQKNPALAKQLTNEIQKTAQSGN